MEYKEGKCKEQAVAAAKELITDNLEEIFEVRTLLLTPLEDEPEEKEKLREEIDTFIAEESKEIIAKMEAMNPLDLLMRTTLSAIKSSGISIDEAIRDLDMGNE